MNLTVQQIWGNLEDETLQWCWCWASLEMMEGMLRGVQDLHDVGDPDLLQDGLGVFHVVGDPDLLHDSTYMYNKYCDLTFLLSSSMLNIQIW